MPVVELEFAQLSKLVGIKNTKKLLQMLPYLGLDIEGEDAHTVRVEYSPNRPDYSTVYGIAAGLRYMGGKSKPAPKFPLKSGTKLNRIRVDSAVSKVRPYIVGIIARGKKLGNSEIKMLMAMQEDLHMGLCRNRKKSSIGVHNLGAVSFPLSYGTAELSEKFVPLGSVHEMSVADILKKTPIGALYGNLLQGFARVPLLKDSTDSVISLPPIINAASTALTAGVDGIFVEVTGTERRNAEDALSIVSATLSEMGFTIYEVGVSGAGNSTAKLLPVVQKLPIKLVSDTLGLDMGAKQVRSSLAKSGIYSTVSGANLVCHILRHRFDIFGPMDLVEEAILGYGVQNITPKLSPHPFIGSLSAASDMTGALGYAMVGLGCTEAKNSALVEGDGKKNLKVAANTVLRSSLLDGLLDSLSHNVHEEYPQRLFEIGTVFDVKSPVHEETHLCAVLAHGGANYTEAKSLLQAVLSGLGLKAKTAASKHPLLDAGQSASVEVGGKKIGSVGTIAGTVRSDRKIRQSVSAFEIDVSGLIFD